MLPVGAQVIADVLHLHRRIVGVGHRTASTTHLHERPVVVADVEAAHVEGRTHHVERVDVVGEVEVGKSETGLLGGGERLAREVAVGQ